MLIIADALMDLSEPLRLVAPWALVVTVAIAGFVVWSLWGRPRERRLALQLEKSNPALGNSIINAVDLSHVQGQGAIQEYLLLETLRRGEEAAKQAAVWPMIRQSVRFASIFTGAAFAAWLLFMLLAGDVLRAVTPRFADPRGDHPPYSKLRFDVSPGRTNILFGSSIEVRATVAGGKPAAGKLWLMAKSGTNDLRAIMFLSPDQSFFQSLANLREPTEYYVTDGKARSHRFRADIRYTPQITLVELTSTFPAYTGIATRTAKLAEDPQSLPVDTRLDFRVFSNRPLKEGELTLTPVLGGKEQKLVLHAPPNQNYATGSFSLAEPLIFSIKVTDQLGLQSVDPRQGRVNISPDQRPRLFVLEPGRDAVATPDFRVPVRVEATDDYGISRVIWLRSHNRSKERPLQMKLELQAGAKKVQGLGDFDLAKLGTRPGDLIEYYFEASDNDPKGPNMAFSRLYRLEVISKEQYDMILKQAAARKALFEPYFQLSSWLRRMSERARDLDKQTQSGSAAQKEAAARDLELLAKDLANFEQELGKLLGQAVLFDVEQAFRDTLVTQHTQIQALRKNFESSLKQGQSAAAASDANCELAEMSDSQQDNIATPAREIAVVAQIMAGANSFVRLAQQQALLARMAQRFSDRQEGFSRSEQMALQELGFQQGGVREGLRKLLDSLPALLEQLPDEPDYNAFRKQVENFIVAVEKAGIESDMQHGSSLFAKPNGKEAFAAAQTAAQKMDALIARCNQMGDQGVMCLKFQPAIQNAMGSTLQQILGALGAASGSGEGGQDGYGLYNDDVALYGPHAELAGQQSARQRDTLAGTQPHAESIHGSGQDRTLREAPSPARVRLRTDARFPMRYRDIVGEYFKSIAESESASDGGSK
ncbi:MAG TPA: hypothetical protein VN673_15480 [Clostridia bacterium]|nr:hypothetical protein [Clostridia bacterium]